MSDFIRREDAIDALKKYEELESNNFTDTSPISMMTAATIANCVEEIVNLPSAESERKWIQCNARMPEEREWLGTKRFGTTISDEVYVTFENPKGERFCKHLSFQNGKLSRYDQSTIDAFYPDAKPIAWMPLPEPWEGE